MKHKETGYVFAVKMINDDLMESNDRRNSDIMDLEAPLKFGGNTIFYKLMHSTLANPFFSSLVFIITFHVIKRI